MDSTLHRSHIALWTTFMLFGLGDSTLAHGQHQPLGGVQSHETAAVSTSSVRWNARARQLASPGAGHGHGAAMGGRTFALLSVAQLAAAEASEAGAVPIAVATASAAVLSGLFPAQAQAIRAHLERDRAAATTAGANVAAGESLGRAVAAQVLARAAEDGHDGERMNSLRTGQGYWVSAPSAEPVGTRWGSVRPWLIRSREEYRPDAPPALESAGFREALDEVRRATRERTPEQLALARKWMHPVDGYWNEVAAELIGGIAASEATGARILALMNIAIVDAVITGFDTKYHFQFPRPSQVDSTIAMAVGLPNHPSYVSGHAAVAGAASAVLAHFFPDQAEHLRATADEIALSRLYAGVHYRFDNEIGLRIGRAIAERVLEVDPSVADLLGE